MIKTRIIGGMGNQLFQYAFGLSSAKKHNTIAVFSNLETFKLHQYFKLGYLGSLLRNKVTRFFLLKLINRINLNVEKTSNFLDPTNFISKNNTHYHGFFQSRLHFKFSEGKIRKHFDTLNSITEEFNKKYKTLFDNNTVLLIHIRRTDYLTHGNEQIGGKNVALPWTYYEKALSTFPKLNEYKIIVIGDDLTFFKKNSHNLKLNFLYERNSEILDFMLLKHADALILSNSTFAWWGSYLNRKKNVVIAPKYWLGFKVKEEYPVGITQGVNLKLI